MNKRLKVSLIASIMVLNTMAVSTNAEVKQNQSIESIYSDAYKSTKKAMEDKSQASINTARIKIKKLPDKFKSYRNEFSKQLDVVQHRILVNINSSIKKAKENTNQTNINLARESVPNELVPVYRNSYSSALDAIQQSYINKVVSAVKKAETEKTKEAVDNAEMLVSDLKTSNRSSIVNVATLYETRVDSIEVKPDVTVDYSIDDPILESAIRTAIGKSTGELTEQDLLKVTSLDIAGRGITSLKGLENCKNLSWLNVGYRYNPVMGAQTNSITDITPLKNLTKITYLGLSFNEITSIDALSNLVNLKTLNIAGTKVKDISVVSNFKNLDYLGLGRLELTNVDSLPALTNLKRLDMTYIDLNDRMYNVLKTLTNLSWVSFYSDRDTNDNYVASLRKILVNCEIDYQK